MAKKKLTDLSPREVAGRDTILRYNYQFRRTAEASLQLLEDKNLERVFCDYHDDYVLKILEGERSVFIFHQVKSKKKESDQWDRKEVFGLGKTKNKAGDGKDSIAGKLFLHHIEFGPNCKSVQIISNVFFKEEIDTLIEDVLAAKLPDDLKKESVLSKRIFDFFGTEFDSISEADIFDFLKKFEVKGGRGKLVDAEREDDSLFLKRIYDYSEIPLDQSQAKKIGESLVSLAQSKSMAEIPPNVTEKDLEKYASIELSDVIKILSISQAAYDELKNGGDVKALRTASILKRLLDRSKATELMIVSACKSKVAWENWHRQHRHAMTDTDYSTLQLKVSQALDSHVRARISLEDLGSHLNQIANEFQGKLPSGITLNVDLVFGLFWSLAVMEELK